jgi:hypothetical protein
MVNHKNLIHCYYYNYEMVFKMSMAIGYANIVYMGLDMCETSYNIT